VRAREQIARRADKLCSDPDDFWARSKAARGLILEGIDLSNARRRPRWEPSPKWANPIRIGDSSLSEGGLFEPHVSHDKGLDVDVAIMTMNPRVMKRHVNNPTYSRDLTRELIQAFLAEKLVGIDVIFFSDEQLAEEFEDVIRDDGIHWTHFHIRYKESGP
jgi:hypothetical protein